MLWDHGSALHTVNSHNSCLFDFIRLLSTNVRSAQGNPFSSWMGECVPPAASHQWDEMNGQGVCGVWQRPSEAMNSLSALLPLFLSALHPCPVVTEVGYIFLLLPPAGECRVRTPSLCFNSTTRAICCSERTMWSSAGAVPQCREMLSSSLSSFPSNEQEETKCQTKIFSLNGVKMFQSSWCDLPCFKYCWSFKCR